jgi:hypothetical protein
MSSRFCIKRCHQHGYSIARGSARFIEILLPNSPTFSLTEIKSPPTYCLLWPSGAFSESSRPHAFYAAYDWCATQKDRNGRAFVSTFALEKSVDFPLQNCRAVLHSVFSVTTSKFGRQCTGSSKRRRPIISEWLMPINGCPAVLSPQPCHRSIMIRPNQETTVTRE